ncbi:MAG: Molybdate/tungstate import ATP-binding protein WtpC [Methanoregula sp. PtaU1.Bin051]|nr:MAG: Molybdate/tungstate import ATP-binding protein WtpC [Methanoregula sp. PtaU1.Bin051]
MLTTLLRPTEGTASICGYDILKNDREVRKHISYVPQDMAVDIKLTGRENVLFYTNLYGVNNPKDRADEPLSVMELSDRADDLTRTYSGGMRRRLELAQALIHQPEVQFLDEPTLGLDVAARRRIWEHISALKKTGMTIFVTTHYMDEADQHCERVGIISKGKIVALGFPSALKARLMKDIITVTIDGECNGVTELGIRGIEYLGCKGSDISFTAEKGREALPIIADIMVRDGILIRQMALREPTLDDVFLLAVAYSRQQSFS